MVDIIDQTQDKKKGESFFPFFHQKDKKPRSSYDSLRYLIQKLGRKAFSQGSQWQWRRISIRILHELESWGIITIQTRQLHEWVLITRERTIITTFPIHQGITTILLALLQPAFATAGDQARYILTSSYAVFRLNVLRFFNWFDCLFQYFNSDSDWDEQKQCKQSVTWW